MHQCWHEQERVAIRRRARDISDADRAARAGAVCHREGLLEVSRVALGERPQQQVDAAARRIRNDKLDVALRIFGGLHARRCNADGCRENGRDRGSTLHHDELAPFQIEMHPPPKEPGLP
jgi:hypothetical protein